MENNLNSLIATISALVVGIIVYKKANFFLSRSDFYRNSPYNILVKKIGFATSASFLTYLIVNGILEKWKMAAANSGNRCTTPHFQYFQK